MTWIEQLWIGIVGSVIGALVVYFAQYGFRLRAKQRQRAREIYAREKENWQSGNPVARQEIANHYLFAILRNFVLGELLWLTPDMLEYMTYAIINKPERFEDPFLWVNAIGYVLSLFFFYLALGTILRYARLNYSQSAQQLKDESKGLERQA
jgi:hypothetical protein